MKPPVANFAGQGVRRNTDKAEVTWNADVSEETLRELDRLLPITGTRTWAINRGLSEFLIIMEADANLVQAAHQDIQRALYAEETPSNLRALNIKIPTPQYERFNELFPEWGATTWFIRRFVAQLVAEMRHASFDPAALVKRAIAAMITS